MTVIMKMLMLYSDNDATIRRNTYARSFRSTSYADQFIRTQHIKLAQIQTEKEYTHNSCIKYGLNPV